MNNKLLSLVLLLSGSVPAAAADTNDPPPITRESLHGRWRGGDLSGLNSILWFEKEQVRILTFRQDKHLSTVNARYHVSPRSGKVTLGINGEALLLPDGALQMKLTREFPHITVLREATLRRMPETKKPSPERKAGKD